MNDQPNFKLGVDASTLAKCLESCDIGTIIPYSELNKLIGGDVQLKNHGALTTARKLLLREHRIVFGVIHGVGLKRLNPSEVVEQESTTIGKIKRASRRSMTRLAAADYDSLTADEQAKHRIVSSTLGAVALCTGTKAQHRLEQQARSSAELEIGTVMKLFASTP